MPLTLQVRAVKTPQGVKFIAHQLVIQPPSV
jgi:hypothetical protein